MTQDAISAAIDLVFQQYYRLLSTDSRGALSNLLAALHQLEHQLFHHFQRGLRHLPEHIALNTLRQHYHHPAVIRPISDIQGWRGREVTTELGQVVLLLNDHVRTALANKDDNYTEDTLRAIYKPLKFWGGVVDIHPCIFNHLNQVLKRTQQLKLAGNSAEYLAFKQRYDAKTQAGESPAALGAMWMVSGTVPDNPAGTLYACQQYLERLYHTAPA